MQRLPSVKTLSTVFAHNAKQARRVLEMKRADLEQIKVCGDMIARCYHAPSTHDLRMVALNELADTFGVEAFQTDDGEWCDYLNAGDAYAVTLTYWHGRYRVQCWGDIAERHANSRD